MTSSSNIHITLDNLFAGHEFAANILQQTDKDYH